MATYKYGYKVLMQDREAPMGSGQWPQEGEWTEFISDPAMCQRGWHIIPAKEHIQDWMRGHAKELYVVEYRERDVADSWDNKIVVKQARLVEKLEVKTTKPDLGEARRVFAKVDQTLVDKSRSKVLKEYYSYLMGVLGEGKEFDFPAFRKLEERMLRYIERLDSQYWCSPIEDDPKLNERRWLAHEVHDVGYLTTYAFRNKKIDWVSIKDLPPDRRVEEKEFDVVVTIEAENFDDALALVKSTFPKARPMVG